MGLARLVEDATLTYLATADPPLAFPLVRFDSDLILPEPPAACIRAQVGQDMANGAGVFSVRVEITGIAKVSEGDELEAFIDLIREYLFNNRSEAYLAACDTAAVKIGNAWETGITLENREDSRVRRLDFEILAFQK